MKKKYPPLYSHVYQNRGDHGTEPITKIAEGQEGKNTRIAHIGLWLQR